MSDDLRLAFEFMERGDIGGLHAEQTQFGTLHSDPRYPRRWDSNYHAVDRQPEEVSADELEADVERAQAAAGFEHRCILFRHEETAERLAPTFVARGWEVDRGVVMAVRRPAEKQVDASLAVEVDLETLRAARQANMPPWGEVETRKQMIDAKHGIAERVSVRCFAVLVDAEVVSYTDLYQDGAVAQIEDVATSEQHQRRGYARAVVTKAVEEARAAGAELIFLVTDADGRAQQLYARLGFDAIGGYVKFRREAPTTRRE